MRQFLLALLLMLGLPIATLAMEPGTYRAGNPYYSVPSQAASQCEAHCKGDAQCKGWNYVRNQKIRFGGICEFNARKATPVPSSISTSGDNEFVRASNQIIQAGSNTIRVGQSRSLDPVLSMNPTPTPQAHQTQHAYSNRHRVNQSTPALLASRLASHSLETESLTAQQNQSRGPHFAPPQTALPPAPAYSSPQRPHRPQFAHNLDDPFMPAAAQQAMTPPAYPPTPQPYAHPPQPQPASYAAPQPPVNPSSQPRVYGGPKPASSPLRPALQNLVKSTQPSVTASIPVPTAQNNLYGSLYDDVTSPAPITQPAILLDTNQSIPTVSAMPSPEITSSSLDMVGPPSLR